MSLEEHQKWLIDFYKQRDWYQYPPSIRLNFLTEEVGELSRAIRTIEIGRDHPGEKKQTPGDLQANLQEELADILDQVLILCSKYDIAFDELFEASESKLSTRYK